MYTKLTFACALISFLMVISCAKPEEKAWRNVTSVDEVLGEWEVIVSVRLSENPVLPVLTMPVTLSFSTDNNQNYIYEMTADCEQILDTVVEYAMTDGEVHLTKDEFWEMVVSTDDYISEDNRESFYGKYYVRIRTTIPFEEQDTFGRDNYQLDQSGDRLKWLYGDIVPAPYIPYIVEEEVILQRR